MSAPGRVVGWICAVVVALPLSPCAFFSTACCAHDEPATDEVVQTSERPCCASHAAPAEKPDRPQPEKPCQGECCLLSPFVQTGEKLVLAVPPAALAAAIVHFDAAPAGEAVLLSSAAPQPLSLQVLHCQWRC